MLDVNEYEGGTLSSINHYFNDFDEPFIKGLLRDKGSNLLFKIEVKQNEILVLMKNLVSDFKLKFNDSPVYLYLKREQRYGTPNRSKAFTLIWRVSRTVCGTGDNTMITQLFSPEGKNDALLSLFGPAMRKQLREYDDCRLTLNMAESLLRYQKKSIQSFYQATSQNELNG